MYNIYIYTHIHIHMYLYISKRYTHMLICNCLFIRLLKASHNCKTWRWGSGYSSATSSCRCYAGRIASSPAHCGIGLNVQYIAIIDSGWMWHNDNDTQCGLVILWSIWPRDPELLKKLVQQADDIDSPQMLAGNYLVTIWLFVPASEKSEKFHAM